MSRQAKDPSKVIQSRVFMVELKIPMENTPPVTFFSSKKAIFEYFGNNTLGITYSTSRIYNFKKNPYENAKCRIEEGLLYSINCAEVIERRKREGREELPNAGSFKSTE